MKNENTSYQIQYMLKKFENFTIYVYNSVKNHGAN